MNWDALAEEFDCEFQGGDGLARKALAAIVGEECLFEAVDKALEEAGPGSELARSVLAFLRVESAMLYSYQRYQTTTDAEVKRSTVALLKHIGNKRVLQWVPEFLLHEDEGVQNWGAAIVDQLVFSGLAKEEDCREVLKMMAQHPNRQVVWHHSEALKYLSSEG